jgi:spore coat polysaccharide biosynthesis protein SpsF (cytidylyltransferase family)
VPEDLEFLRAVCARFQDQDVGTWRNVVALLEREPALVEINNKVSQRAMHEG